MRNRAKCKLCQAVIESFHLDDYVDCKCGEISIGGGQYKLYCSAKDFANFLRVDEYDKEIAIKVIEKGEEVKEVKPGDPFIPTDIKYEKPSKQDMLDMLDAQIKNIENLPQQAMYAPITHYDLCSSLILISSILRAE